MEKDNSTPQVPSPAPAYSQDKNQIPLQPQPAYDQQQMYNQQYQQPMQQQPMPVPQMVVFRKSPVAFTCPFCHQQGMSIVDKEAGLGTWLIAGGTCLICFCCACVPFFIDDLKDTIHKCPNCHQVVGENKLIK
ncbi:LITAF-like zinc ribbon domain-containing protein [Globomyces pollinis-pini]|nr:LITAF-like zinc ribbon domain-containing protein [Globomyces pollinis-pini]